MLNVLLDVILVLLPPTTLLLLPISALPTILVVPRLEADSEVEDEDEAEVIEGLDGVIRLDKVLTDEALMSPEELPDLVAVLLVIL